MITVALVLLGIAGAGFLARVVIGPSVADRIVALDGVLLVAFATLAADAARTGRTVFVDAVLVVGLLGFVGTAIAARFIERKGG